MSDRYAIERLLRPPVEFWSIVVGMCASTIAVLAPSSFMMTPEVGYGCAAVIMLIVVLRRIKQIIPILRYQRNIRKLPTYKLKAKQIPFSKRKLFLGRGFRWTQVHTQRLRDTIRPEAQKYIEMGKCYKWARIKEMKWERNVVLSPISWFISQQKWWNPLRPLPPVGGNPQLHAVEPNEQDIWMDDGERVGHLLVLGTTRVGKTRLAELLITQDIRRGDVVIVIDPKGDADLLRRIYAEAKRAGREKEFYMFHLGYPDKSARYNAVGNFSRITEIAARITTSLPSEGNSAAFREFSWRFTNIVARALVALGQRPDYLKVADYIRDIEPLFKMYCGQWLDKVRPEWKREVARRKRGIVKRDLPFNYRNRKDESIAIIQLIKEENLRDAIADGLVSAFEYDKAYFDKIVGSLLPLLEKLTTGHAAELLSPEYGDMSDRRPIFDWQQVIRKRGICFVGLDALSDSVVSAAVGGAMFADLTSYVGRLYKHGVNEGLPASMMDGDLPKISIHCDEFNEIMGDEFIPMLNKAGGANVRNTVYTQVWSDVEAKVGSKAKAAQVAGNLNNMIMFRVREETTAEMLTSQTRDVEIRSMMEVSGANDASDTSSDVLFTSRNEDRESRVEVPTITVSDVMSLPKGQAFTITAGGELNKIRVPLPDDIGDIEMPDDLEEIASSMKNKYKSSDGWWRGHEIVDRVTRSEEYI